jgi:glycosyltransferase involved in cell wall biosynthesis
MRIAIIAPPWYPVPPSGYGGIEWVVALLADGLTERGHEVTLFAPPGSQTEAELVPPLEEVPPEELIGDPWYEAAHAVSAYEQGEEFDILHDHTGPVGPSIGAMSDALTVHTLHGPFTEQTSMLYAVSPAGIGSWLSPRASGRWGRRTCAGVEWSTTGSPWTATPSARIKRISCSFWAGLMRRRRRTWPSRRPGWPGGGW